LHYDKDMMAKRYSAAVLVFASLWIASETSADIIERQFVEKDSGRTGTVSVLQGSKNMRDLGKRRSSSKSIRVLSPIQAVPGYAYPSKPAEVEPTLQKEVEPQKSKPRFGYGAEKPSDGRTPVETQESAEPQVENNTTASRATDPKSILEGQALSAPVYQFRYTYPQQRDYYYATPFHGFSPFHHGLFGSGCVSHDHFHGPRLPTPPFFSGEFSSRPLSFFFGW
jgi:hypothetical protein